MQLELLRDAGAAPDAVPVYFKTDGGAFAPTDPPQSLKSLCALNNFNGDAGAVLAGSDGVVLGVGDGSDAFVSAAACEKLPEGDFRLAAELAPREATLAALGWLLGAYQFGRYKSRSPRRARLSAPANADVVSAKRAASAIGLVRDLVNTPADDMTPANIENAARTIAERHGVETKAIVGDALLEENFPIIHAVGRAAKAAPRLIDFVWGDENAPKVTLVGKGVAFDSGGLNIKGAGGMSLMKKDMGGAAHVLGLAQMIMDAALPLRLRVLIPAVENAISGDAFRPGDILRSRKGLTVEIGNTDAEGRLILSDALALAAEESPDLLISMATLTGAARVAVGPEIAPFYTDNDDLAAAISRFGTDEADPVWRMPLWKNYQSMLSSTTADMNNISSTSFAGSITAALFLKRFAPPSDQWAHFDIYAWRPAAAPGRPVGGEAQ
ncbi:MAG: leucyl aminopeptidase family protein, partial [Pseudomonadota bacterium]